MSFDALAPHYRWMEFVVAGGKLQRCRTAFLERVGDCRRVLIAGEGNGRFLLACRRRLAHAEIVCVDSSQRMLSLARRRLERHGTGARGVDFIQANALQWQPPRESFDLIATHFFLDCFRPNQLERLVGGFAEAARPAAVWLLADFQIPSGGFLRWRARLIHWVMYTFFRVATALPARRLTPPDPLLRGANFVLRERRVTEGGLLHSDFWQRTT